MEKITLVLKPGLGLNFEAMRPALQVGAAVAIGRGGAVIDTVVDVAHPAVSPYPGAAAARRPVEPELDTPRTPWGNGQQTAQQQENEHWRNLNAARYEWLRDAALDTGSANVPMVRIGMGDPLQGVALDMAVNEAMTNWPTTEDDYYAHDDVLRAADPLGLAENVVEFNKAHTGVLKPGIFDIITGTAGQSVPRKQELPSPEEHAAQIERVAADLREHGHDREELKPCAFCGGPPVPFVQLAAQGFGSAPRLDTYGDDGLSVEAFVFCHECGAHGPQFEDDIFDAAGYDQAMAEGVRLWQDRDGRHADLYEANAELNLFPRQEPEVVDE